MTAPELLAEVEARGGQMSVARDATGAAMLKVSPRGIVPDLTGDIARFKPALLELLAAPDPRDGAAQAIRRRSAGYWAMRRAHDELARQLPADEQREIARLVEKLDAQEEIE